jgi:lactate dehydrogenase-like 2-hydroxyacid dehydrogenase
MGTLMTAARILITLPASNTRRMATIRTKSSLNAQLWGYGCWGKTLGIWSWKVGRIVAGYGRAFGMRVVIGVVTRPKKEARLTV